MWNLPPYSVLLEGIFTPGGSFTKAIVISLARGTLASRKARLALRDITMELGFLLLTGMMGSWNGKNHMAALNTSRKRHLMLDGCSWQEGHNGTQDTLTCRDLWHELIDHDVSRIKADGKRVLLNSSNEKYWELESRRLISAATMENTCSSSSF